MGIIFDAKTPLEAWATVAAQLATGGQDIDQVLTTIDEPTNVESDTLSKYCPRKVKADLGSLRSVVRVLAPDTLKDTGKTRKERYEAAWAWYDKSRQRGLRLSNWKSTYFERLTRWESGTNQLETIIAKMNAWPYERVAAFYAHTTHMDLDHLTPQGNPCLQYVQFLQRKNQPLDMFALYRNHDFLEKALGNYIGLGRLLQFVAAETNQTPGKLSCLSVHAYLKQKQKVLKLATQALS